MNQENQNAPKGSMTYAIIAGAIIVIVLGAFFLGKARHGSSAVLPTASSTMATSTVAIATSTSTASKAVAPRITLVPAPASSSAPFIYELATDKTAYSKSDVINMDLSVTNNTSAARTFYFSSGCQADYMIGSFDMVQHTRCVPGPSSFAIQPAASVNIPLAEYPSVYALPAGTYQILAVLIGYGGATTTVTITQ